MGAGAGRRDRRRARDDYYRRWLAALERLIVQRGLADGEALARYREAWTRAAARTPHGTPIELSPADF